MMKLPAKSHVLLGIFLMILCKITVMSLPFAKKTNSQVDPQDHLNYVSPHEALNAYGDGYRRREEKYHTTTLTYLDLYSEHFDSFSDPNKKDVAQKRAEEYANFTSIESTSASNNIQIKINGSNSSSSSVEENQKFESAESEAKSSGAMLDEFVSGKLSSGDIAPIFLTEPENVYVVKNRPAVLKCKAAHALQIYFKCSGTSQPPPSVHDQHVDPHTGVHLEEVTATIHRDLVDEYFGKGPFKCECIAWTSRGEVKSQAATINIAYIRKQFVTSPTSLKVEIGSRAELHCEAPPGFPEPKIVWYKNNAPITKSNEYEISVSGTGAGSLQIKKVSLQDMANYTCVAENIAGKRVSDSAVVIVYVNGGWSSWSSWKDCKCTGKPSQGRKRLRSCNNPLPLNGGGQCAGPQVQKSPDCVPCPEDTQIVAVDGYDVLANKRWRWSAWSEWSICSIDCIQVRRRKCINGGTDENNSGNITSASNAGYVKTMCPGKDTQTAECRGNNCTINSDAFDWTLFLGLFFVATVCFMIGTTFVCYARRAVGVNRHYNIPRTVIDTEYMKDVDKKDIGMHIDSADINYEYVNPDHGTISNDLVGCGLSEHHYDVPNMAVNYTNPIDEVYMDYITGASTTSIIDAATFENKPLLVSKGVISKTIDRNGGSLNIYGDEIILYIPELAIAKHHKKHISLMLLNDDTTRLSIPSADYLLICSNVVLCTPLNYNLLKPVIIKIPHCLVNPEQWNVNIYHADNEKDDMNVVWRKIVAIGEETINTPVFVHVEPSHVYIMAEQLGRFVIIAEKPNCVTFEDPSVYMRLYAYNQFTPNSSNCSLRIYIVKDLPNSKDLCTSIESQLGGSYMGESDRFTFRMNNCNLNIRVRNNGERERDEQLMDELYEHTIPYNHFLSSNSILHCEFTIKRTEECPDLLLDVEYSQCNDTHLSDSWDTFVICNENSQTTTMLPERATVVHQKGSGNYTNDTEVLEAVQLPSITKRLICSALDPPRQDERDWRLLAKMLNTDRYIAYFATKPSPTEQILNLWECRTLGSTRTMVEILLTLKEMKRQDIVDAITQTMGPLWI